MTPHKTCMYAKLGQCRKKHICYTEVDPSFLTRAIEVHNTKIALITAAIVAVVLIGLGVAIFASA